MTSRQLILASSVVLLLGISACSSTTPMAPSPQTTPPISLPVPWTPTNRPTQAATPASSSTTAAPAPSPTPTSATPGPHTWQPSPVLLEYRHTGFSQLNTPPELILYSDGLVIRAKYSEATGWSGDARKLSLQEMCALLNSLDWIGFASVNPTTFVSPVIEGPETLINLQAWDSNYVSGVDLLCYALEDDPTVCCFSDVECILPTVVPQLAETVRLLQAYDPGSLQPMPIDAIVVAFREEPDPATPPMRWPLSNQSLQTLYAQFLENGGWNPLVLNGAAARTWHTKMRNGIYRDGTLVLRVESRPLWPHEDPEASLGYRSEIPVTPVSQPLVCSPEDGYLDGYGPQD